MAYKTVESIVKAAIREGLKVYNDSAITDEMIQRAVDAYNASEPFIWRKWPWHNRKVDELSVEADDDGIIVFDGDNSDVDIIRAVRAVDSSVDATGENFTPMIWNQSDIRAAINGEEISSGTFQNLSDDSDGYRRIKVYADDDVTSYKVLAFRRFVQAEVSDSYSESDPTATPYDYRVLTWKIDRTNASLIAYIADELREWMSKDKEGRWTHALNGTIKDIREQEQTEHLVTPKCGMFNELGDWY